MIKAQRLKTKNLLESYNLIIEDIYNIDLTNKEDQIKQFDLLLIFVKYIKVKYIGIRNKSIASFLDVEIENILLYLKKHDELFLIDTLFREKSNFLRERFRAIDSENKPEIYKDKLYALIDVSPESVRKEYYELIFQYHDILKSNLHNTK